MTVTSSHAGLAIGRKVPRGVERDRGLVAGDQACKSKSWAVRESRCRWEDVYGRLRLPSLSWREASSTADDALSDGKRVKRTQRTKLYEPVCNRSIHALPLELKICAVIIVGAMQSQLKLTSTASSFSPVFYVFLHVFVECTYLAIVLYGFFWMPWPRIMLKYFTHSKAKYTACSEPFSSTPLLGNPEK